MSKSHQIVRVFLLVLLPFVVGVTPYLAYKNCMELSKHTPAVGESASCGWPFSLAIIQTYAYSGPVGKINYVGLSADFIFWLISLATWAAVFRTFGPGRHEILQQRALQEKTKS